jgi:hypothetical protein
MYAFCRPYICIHLADPECQKAAHGGGLAKFPPKLVIIRKDGAYKVPGGSKVSARWLWWIPPNSVTFRDLEDVNSCKEISVITKLTTGDLFICSYLFFRAGERVPI